MNLHRFYCNPIVRPETQLPCSEARHLAQVLRLKAGDKVELFDGNGKAAIATIKSAGGKQVILQVEDLQVLERPVQQIILAVSVAKGERFDWIVGKCTELGVDRIMPVLFARTVKQPKNPKIVERWNNIAIAAAKQSRRIFLPRIDKPVKLPDAVEIFKKDYPNGAFIFGGLSEGSKSVLQFAFTGKDVIAFVGPEGGLTGEEENLLRENDAESVRLTDTILRIETAAVLLAGILAAQRNAQLQK